MTQTVLVTLKSCFHDGCPRLVFVCLLVFEHLPLTVTQPFQQSQGPASVTLETILERVSISALQSRIPMLSRSSLLVSRKRSPPSASLRKTWLDAELRSRVLRGPRRLLPLSSLSRPPASTSPSRLALPCTRCTLRVLRLEVVPQPLLLSGRVPSPRIKFGFQLK